MKLHGIYCKKVFLIQTKEELNLQDIQKFLKVGIMAGASTPDNSIQEVVHFLQSKC